VASDPTEDDGGFDSPHSPLPTMIGPYHVVGKLGGGSMADLYIAHKMSAYGAVRRAVIKRVKRSRTDFKHLEKMLIDEARATACFDHPNVVSIIDIGEDDGSVFVALEYVEGTDLRRVNTKLRARREALPFELAVFIVAEVLRGLHHAHSAVGPDGKSLEIVHRDVNPANVLVSITGHVKLADFGVVRMRDRIQENTEPGLVKGKYAYLAPEYIAGENCSVQTDIYAAGVMLFEMLSGRECFTGKTAYEVMWKIVNQGVPMYRLEREGVPDDLRRIVERATSVAPERRYTSGQDMANALEAWLMRSGRHATPWVLSVFFTRHRLYPDSTDTPRALPQLTPPARKALPAPKPEVQREIETATQARTVETTDSLTPMPELEELPPSYEIPMLAPELQALPTDSSSATVPPFEMFETTPRPTKAPRHATPTNPPELIDPSMAPTPEPVFPYAPLDLVVDASPTPPRLEINVEAKQIGDSAWVEFSKQEKPKLPSFDPHASPTIPAMKPPKLEDLHDPPPDDDDEIPTTPPSSLDGVPLTGKLEDMPAVDVLDTITGRDLSGTLEFRCGLIWKRVQICRGLPMGITSNMGMELIGEHLVKARLITRRDLDHALAAAERSGSLLTAKLLELGLLTREVLEEELGKNLGARLTEVLEWRWGTYDFREEPVQESDLKPRLDLAALIEDTRDALEKRSEEELKKDPTGEHTPQKKLKEALRVARSIASSSGKGRVDRVDPGSSKR
jgi:serine/threonine protein kinase